jgi:hypothetical protein
MDLPPSFGTQRRILESQKDFSIEMIKKDQQSQEHPAVNLPRDYCRRCKREKSCVSTAQGF